MIGRGERASRPHATSVSLGALNGDRARRPITAAETAALQKGTL
jgi:hypothetical protein